MLALAIDSSQQAINIFLLCVRERPRRRRIPRLSFPSRLLEVAVKLGVNAQSVWKGLMRDGQ